jgi:hypothetical protein
VTTQDAAPRNADILRRRVAGETLEAIAKAHGISRTRVREVLAQTIERATTTEAERQAKREEARQRRFRARAEWEARVERERQEREEATRRNTLVVQIARVEPSWPALNNFGWWLRENEAWYRAPPQARRGTTMPLIDPVDPDYLPAFRAADRAIAQWLDGRANEHMTVLRLRRLTEVPA